jgi:hypothetical protein
MVCNKGIPGDLEKRTLRADLEDRRREAGENPTAYTFSLMNPRGAQSGLLITQARWNYGSITLT